MKLALASVLSLSSAPALAQSAQVWHEPARIVLEGLEAAGASTHYPQGPSSPHRFAQVQGLKCHYSPRGFLPYSCSFSDRLKNNVRVDVQGPAARALFAALERAGVPVVGAIERGGSGMKFIALTHLSCSYAWTIGSSEAYSCLISR